MKKLLIFIFLFWYCSYVSAQTLTSVVCDKNTKEPVPFAYVYFDRTSINTLTDTLGRFKLDVKSVINAKLVLQHLTYESLIIDNPFAGLPDTLFMEEKLTLLNEIAITANRDNFTREQKMRAFREQFLGLTNAGRSCTIMNEDDIHLSFNTRTRRLQASADVPIVLVNNYLGYRMIITLRNFWAEYKRISLNRNHFLRAYYSVDCFFIDQNLNNKKIEQHRSDVFKYSPNYFFKCFVDDSYQDNGFQVFIKGNKFDTRQYFSITDTESQKRIVVLPNTDILKYSSYFNEYFKGIISVYYKFAAKSDIHFRSETLLIDRYGNVDDFDKVFYSGNMGESRIGDMLPIDYEPAGINSKK